MIVTTTNTIALEMVGEVRFKRYLGVKPKNLLLNCVLGKGRVLFKKKKKNESRVPPRISTQAFG